MRECFACRKSKQRESTICRQLLHPRQHVLHQFRFKKISATHYCNDITPKEIHPMSLQCPRCHSPKVASFHHAMKVGAVIGTVGGAARGVSAALAGGQAGAALGAFAGPVGVTLGSVSGAILGGLAGGAGGCALGAQLGESLTDTSWPTTSACSAVTASTCRPDLALPPLSIHIAGTVLRSAQHVMPACTQRNLNHGSSRRNYGLRWRCSLAWSG